MCLKQSSFPFVMLVFGLCASSSGETSVFELVNDIYKGCLSDFSIACLRPKALHWITNAAKQDVIQITDDLSLVKTSDNTILSDSTRRADDHLETIVENVDNYFANHALSIKPPVFLRSGKFNSLLPKWLIKTGSAEKLRLPLVASGISEGRGFVRKVMVPFLLGLKFKTTVLVPIALALIALKSWKAMTLGLLSLVLSGALVIFKMVKPNIVNYEVVHYPPVEHIDHHSKHHLNHLGYHVDHHLDHHHIDNHLGYQVDHHLDHQHIDDHLDHHLDHHHIEHPVKLSDHFDHEHTENIPNLSAQTWGTEAQGWARQGTPKNLAT